MIENVRANEPQIAALLEPMRDLPFVGDIRGCGHFWAIEVVKDKATALPFTEDEGNWILKGALSGAIQDRGLLCRLDDRDQPVIQLSPPLVADMDTIGEMLSIVGDSLIEVDGRVRRGEAPWA